MVHFKEVLDGVRLALTWASPAEVQALLEGLVEEEIISEAYSRSLSLDRLTEGNGSLAIHYELRRNVGSTGIGSESVKNFGSRECDNSQTFLESLIFGNEQSSTESWTNMPSPYGCQDVLGEEPTEDGHYLRSRSPPDDWDTQCSLDHDAGEMEELLRCAEWVQKPVSDSERTREGNSHREREWSEQVEEAARRIAVPLWQHWDRGQKMLLPLVPSTAFDSEAGENPDGGAPCPLHKLEQEAELAVACKSLGSYSDVFREENVTASGFVLDPEAAADVPVEFCFSSSAPMPVLNMDYVSLLGAAEDASPVQACTATGPDDGLADALEDQLRTAEDLVCLSPDAGCIDAADLLSPSTPADICSIALDNSFYSCTHRSTAVDVTDDLENVFQSVCGSTLSICDVRATFLDSREDVGRVDSQLGAKMQDEDQDPLFSTEYGELPEDISEYMNDNYLPELEDGLFEELQRFEELDPFSDVFMPEFSGLDDLQQTLSSKPSGNNNRKKRRRASRSQQRDDADSTPSKPKRSRAAGQQGTKNGRAERVAVHSPDSGSEPSPVKTPVPAPPSTRIVRVSPPIQFIIPDGPWLRFPFHSSAPAPRYILVPASPPSCKPQVPPLSPVNGAVAPVQMSSSPQGSDTAIKAVSPPLSPNNDVSPCRESPQSPTVLDIPQSVKDYIKEAKAHMSHICQDMEEGLSLDSHYVSRKVCQKEARSGKNTNRCLDKELVSMGETDRQKSLIDQSQIFDSCGGDKPKRCILLFGNAGMGKSTLIRKLCLDWSRDCVPHFDFVFLLDGKALAWTEPTHSLQTLLLDPSTCAPPCMDADAVYAQILAAPKRVLIIFDGFDELRDYEILLQNQEKDLITALQKDSKAASFTARQLYAAILQRVLLAGCTLLLSTRPKGNVSQILRRADSFLEVCGFTPADVEAYLSQYFPDPGLRESALDCLKNCNYLHLLCWNPGLCRLVCLLLEHSQRSEDLPKTLTGLCHRVLQLKMEKDYRSTHSQGEDQTQTPEQAVEETQTQTTTNNRTKSRANVRTRSRGQRAKTAKEQETEQNEVSVEEPRMVGSELERKEERELLVQLSSLAWEGVKANSSVLSKGRTLPDKLTALGLRIGLFLSRPLGKKRDVLNAEKEGGGREETGERGGEKEERNTKPNSADASHDHILLWANPFLQSYLAGVHLSLSRSVSDRSFQQTLLLQLGLKGRRRPQREENELTQRCAIGLLFHRRTELQRLHSHTETVFRDMLVSKQALVRKHLEGLSHDDLSPSQVLEACHYVHEASLTHGEDRRDGAGSGLVAHLAQNLPQTLEFSGVPLNPPDVFTVQKVLEKGGTEGKSFCLDLENSGIHVSGLRALMGLNNIDTFRACIADVIALWEQLEQSGEGGLLRAAVSRFQIQPLKATQVCHIEHLAKLVHIHVQRRLSDSSGQTHSILAEGVPAVKELRDLEFELDPDKSALGLPKLWELLPGLTNLQRLEIEKRNIGDKGAEQLAEALASLSSLKILSLSQNCLRDQGVKKLASTLRDLPKLQCLSLYSNEISDEGAEALAAVLPHMPSLTELDIKYNKLTDVGAEFLAASLKNCPKMKNLRMWNQCIPYGAFERLQKQDSRILWH